MSHHCKMLEEQWFVSGNQYKTEPKGGKVNFFLSPAEEKKHCVRVDTQPYLHILDHIGNLAPECSMLVPFFLLQVLAKILG